MQTTFGSSMIINAGQRRQLKFSETDISVLQWLAHGKHIEDIAMLMEVKETAVRARIGRIKDRIGANTLAGAVAIALRAGFIK